MSDRFELEENIMKCSLILEEIDILMDVVVDDPSGKYDMKPEVLDRITNKLLGIRELYEMRFERLDRTFTAMIKEGKL